LSKNAGSGSVKINPDPQPWSLEYGIQQGCGSGFSDFVDPDPGARKLRNFSGKMHVLVIKKKKFTTRKG
jgi:hypothetical protein